MQRSPPANHLERNTRPGSRGGAEPRHERSHERRAPRPLDAARLEELALAYTARFATSASKLEAYLGRKLRQQGWAAGTGEGAGAGAEGGDDHGDRAMSEAAVALAGERVTALVTRFVEAGYVDDESFARAKAGSLLRRGYGARRIVQALGEAGIAAEIRAEALPDDGQARLAALAMARKRRFGPWALEHPDPARAEKQVAALLRAGHPLGSARAVVHARSPEEAEQWAAEACED